MSKHSAKHSGRSADPGSISDGLEGLDEFVGSRVPSADEATRREIVELLHEQQTLVRGYAGPLPPPSMLQDYDSVAENGAERIMAMAEKEQNHRHNWETSALAIESSATKLSISGGIIIALGLIAGAIYAVYLGHILIAAAFLGGPAIGMVVQILNWRKRRADDDAEEARNSRDREQSNSRTETLERAESKRSRRRRR